VTARRTHALLRPSVAVPFLIVALIWGSTWFVIRDQLAAAPPSWSVAYRFAIATIAMFLLAARGRGSLALTGREHLLALGIGLFQFCANFNFVYPAELYVTSGIVAVLFGLLMVPNALLARIFLGTPITARFVLGTLVALGGIALLLAHEFLEAPVGAQVALGIGLTVLGILSASVANVLQASQAARARPLFVLLAWAMLWGTVCDAAFAFGVAGPPIFPADLRYWAGVVYLALLGSVVAFPLYFGLIREIGPGRAAYNGVLVPVIAMALSTLFEGYAWSLLAAGGAALALMGLVVALRGRNLEAKPAD
jgi:drug/metabolite transporter (DMT)-like permease